jgi:hypothetical protein
MAVQGIQESFQVSLGVSGSEPCDLQNVTPVKCQFHFILGSCSAVGCTIRFLAPVLGPGRRWRGRGRLSLLAGRPWSFSWFCKFAAGGLAQLAGVLLW